MIEHTPDVDRKTMPQELHALIRQAIGRAYQNASGLDGFQSGRALVKRDVLAFFEDRIGLAERCHSVEKSRNVQTGCQ